MATKHQKSILTAMCMGDGSIGTAGKRTASLKMTHCYKQKEYLEYKARLVNSILGGKKKEVLEFVNNGYPGVRYSKSHRYFRVLRKFLYKGGKKVFSDMLLKRINPESFAIVWMDDGGICPKRRGGKIHAWIGFLNLYEDFETCERWADRLNDVFGVRPLIRKDKGHFRLEFNTTKLRILLPQIEMYSVPCMRYKFVMER